MKKNAGIWIILGLFLGSLLIGGSFWWTLQNRRSFQQQVQASLMEEIRQGPWKQLGLPSTSLQSVNIRGDDLQVLLTKETPESGTLDRNLIQKTLEDWAKSRLGADKKPLKIQVL